MSRILAALLLCFAASVHAAHVSVTAQAGWFASTFEGLGLELGWVNFTYDQSAPDSDPDPARGEYRDALTSFTMTVGQQSRPDLFFTLSSEPSLMVVGSGVAHGDASVQIIATLTEHSGAYGDLAGHFTMYRPGPADDDALPGASFWNSSAPHVVAFVGSLGPAVETDWAWDFRATEIPAPGSAALLGLGLAALACRRSRS